MISPSTTPAHGFEESLPRPSGPFPWASEEDCEFFSAAQAGELPR